ncbi:hypothetical protein QM543_10310 [Pantoea eucrina]|uniref:hypothetical protein n=1 Tax=Pantoea eucrina TaxID=472693 RepID=UPI0024B85894|nr:hypothetical protein [Pantoea eucrina]MDJ0023678.1 hypothetical protein [Pantoea eucrina]
MSTLRRMPALSPEEIRKISEKAVANVAAQKIVTTNSKKPLVNNPDGGALYHKAFVRGYGRTKDADTMPSGLVERARALAASVLSQSNGRQYMQDSFNQVRKTKKA